jgi:putative NADPH-quinone reductase
MNILYLYAHPHRTSFNAALKLSGCDHLVKAGHVLEYSDLYTMQFNAIASWDDFTEPNSETQYFFAQTKAYEQRTLSQDLHDEMTKLIWADHLIMQFPLWWFSMPAIMKGWMDRVLMRGFAYDANKCFETGLLVGKTASLTVTTQSSEEAYQPSGVHGATMAQFLLPIHHSLRFVGIEDLDPFIIYHAYQLSAEQETHLFESYTHYLTKMLAPAAYSLRT